MTTTWHKGQCRELLFLDMQHFKRTLYRAFQLNASSASNDWVHDEIVRAEHKMHFRRELLRGEIRTPAQLFAQLNGVL